MRDVKWYFVMWGFWLCLGGTARRRGVFSESVSPDSEKEMQLSVLGVSAVKIKQSGNSAHAVNSVRELSPFCGVRFLLRLKICDWKRGSAGHSSRVTIFVAKFIAFCRIFCCAQQQRERISLFHERPLHIFGTKKGAQKNAPVDIWWAWEGSNPRPID